MTISLRKLAKQALLGLLAFFLIYSLYGVICLIFRYFIYGLPDGFWYYYLTIVANIVTLSLGLYGVLYDKRLILQLFMTLAGLNATWLSIFGAWASIDYEMHSLARLADNMNLYSWKQNSSESSFERSMITLTWDATQSNNRCCGFKSPFDWNNIRPAGVPGNVFPNSCCLRNSHWSLFGILGSSTRDTGSDCLLSDDDFFPDGCNTMYSPFDVFIIITTAGFYIVMASWAWWLSEDQKETQEGGGDEEEQQLSKQMTQSDIDYNQPAQPHDQFVFN